MFTQQINQSAPIRQCGELVSNLSIVLTLADETRRIFPFRPLAENIDNVIADVRMFLVSRKTFLKILRCSPMTVFKPYPRQ